MKILYHIIATKLDLNNGQQEALNLNQRVLSHIVKGLLKVIIQLPPQIKVKCFKIENHLKQGLMSLQKLLGRRL